MRTRLVLRLKKSEKLLVDANLTGVAQGGRAAAHRSEGHVFESLYSPSDSTLCNFPTNLNIGVFCNSGWEFSKFCERLA